MVIIHDIRSVYVYIYISLSHGNMHNLVLPSIMPYGTASIPTKAISPRHAIAVSPSSPEVPAFPESSSYHHGGDPCTMAVHS